MDYQAKPFLFLLLLSIFLLKWSLFEQSYIQFSIVTDMHSSTGDLLHKLYSVYFI